MKKFLQNIVKLKKISTIYNKRFPARVTLFTDHRKKDRFYLHRIYSIQSNLFKSHLVILTLKSIPSVFMYAMNIQNDVIGLVLRENCKSKQMTDIIA